MRHLFDKTRVANSTAFVSATLVMFEISVWLNYLAARSEAMRYVQQLTYILTVVLAVLTLNSLKKLIPKTLRRAVLDKFLYAVRKVAANIANVSKKLLSIFGVDLSRYKKRRDERSFIFDRDEDGVFRRKHSVKNTSKWKDLTENADKIRFIYIKYIIKIIKEGYKFRSVLTPNEVCEDLNLEEERPERSIFEYYNGARYSGGSIYITDEQVESALAIVNAKKK
ncbi:MAG: hypothetical protein E7634_07060 [Ruminococcaceae bacterium]|nr:hypothetical protein [Oscillospiraceae bacterium]